MASIGTKKKVLDRTPFIRGVRGVFCCGRYIILLRAKGNIWCIFQIHNGSGTAQQCCFATGDGGTEGTAGGADSPGSSDESFAEGSSDQGRGPETQEPTN